MGRAKRHLRHPALHASRPLVVAHRGGGALAPENTFAAFDRGLAEGADALELDVRLARDRVGVVIHDADLDRTTVGTGPVSAFTANELAGIDAGYRFGPEQGYPFRGRGLGVPRLGDVLARYSVPLIVELKGDDPAVAHIAVEEIRAAGAIDRVCVGGYSRRVVRAVRALEPAIVTGASRHELRWMLYGCRVGWPILAPRCDAVQMPLAVNGSWIVSPRLVRAIHRAGLVMQVWTVNDPADIRRLLEWGVDAIITDRPDVAVPIVRERTQLQ